MPHESLLTVEVYGTKFCGKPRSNGRGTFQQVGGAGWYIGEFSGCAANGFGVVEWSNGATWSGRWANGVRRVEMDAPSCPITIDPPTVCLAAWQVRDGHVVYRFNDGSVGYGLFNRGAAVSYARPRLRWDRAPVRPTYRYALTSSDRALPLTTSAPGPGSLMPHLC